MKIVLIALLLGVSLFAKSVASVTALKGEAFLKRDSKKSVLYLGEKLFEKDSIITGTKAKVQVIFEDETVITIGRNSEFFVDEYLFDDSQKSVVKFGMLKGAMRAITGKIGKIAPQKFSVKTKTTTIGIRGTNFTIIESDDGSSSIYCTFGAIDVTFNNIKHLVNHGFYLYISPQGISELREFNAEDLNIMRDKNFGKTKTKNSNNSLSQEGSENTQQIDTTKELHRTDIVVEDVSQYVKESAQKEPPEALEHESASIPAIYGLAVGDATFNEYGFVYASNSIPALILPIIDDNDENSYHFWNFELNQTPLSYTSKEKFATDFVAVDISSNGISSTESTVKNIVIEDGIFEATGDDLIDGDYMSWGRWSVQVSYEYTNNAGEDVPASHDMDGLWVAGEVTEASVVDALSGSESYSGIYRAKNMADNGNIVNGLANMDVDFGEDRANLYIDFDAANGGRSFDMHIVGGTLEGYQTNGIDESGVSNGFFYGSDASEIGGSFNTTNGGEDELRGVYQLQVHNK
jgi:hypothetical protein